MRALPPPEKTEQQFPHPRARCPGPAPGNAASGRHRGRHASLRCRKKTCHQRLAVKDFTKPSAYLAHSLMVNRLHLSPMKKRKVMKDARTTPKPRSGRRGLFVLGIA